LELVAAARLVAAGEGATVTLALNPASDLPLIRLRPKD